MQTNKRQRQANCLQECAARGQATKLDSLQPTLMAMLECGEPSAAAWPILERHVDFFVDLPDNYAIDAMRALASPSGGDPRVTLGESGAAGLAGVMAVVKKREFKTAIGIDESSVILLIGTEGATDPVRYRELVGLDP